MPKASFRLRILADAETDFRAIPFPFRRQLNQRLHQLKVTPRPDDSEHLDGELHVFVLERWDVLYQIDDDLQLITVVAFAHVAEWS